VSSERNPDIRAKGGRSTAAWWSRSGWTSLPTEVVAGSCRRTAALAWAFAAFWVFGLVMHHFAAPLLGVETWWMTMQSSATAFNLITGAGLLLSLVMAWYARSHCEHGRILLDRGLIFFVVTAFLVSLVTYWEPQPRPTGVSWVAFTIVAYAAIAPNSPRKTFLAALIAASADPVSLLLAAVRGVGVPYHGVELAWIIIPNYLAAGVALISALVVGGLGRQVRQARELGSYRLGDLLGRGGMGEVYRAEHRLLARPAAVKLIRPELLDRDLAADVTERFRREALAAANLSSPHTISLYDFGVASDGTLYYVMELLEGLNLETLIQGHGPQPPERVAHILAQVASSLAEAHGRGLIHRDVKPSNVFLARLGVEVDVAKVLDFGLVAMREGAEAARARLTAPGATPGTPHIMAPELALGGTAPDARADVYALGCLAYWLLTGGPVFPGDSPVQVMLRHVREEVRPPSARSPFTETRRLDGLVLDCLAKSPDDRPRDAAAFAARLAEITFASPWTPQRAREWWAEHAACGGDPGPCDKGELIPEAMGTGAAA
jgi:eukaryotic-like serine/threonine-protein kinase